MNKILLLVSLIIFSKFPIYGQEIILQNGMTIKKSVVIDSSHYKLNARKKNKPVLTIRGNNLVVDFKGATLEGSNGIDSPDQYSGTAIKISKGKNITIRNVKIIGYRKAIEAAAIEGLKLENCEFSYHYRRPREKLAPLTGGKQQGIPGYTIEISKSSDIEILECRATANENVVYMRDCKNALVANNDFSYNSGAAIILKNSHDNQFLYNRFNFNVADTLLNETASLLIDGNSSSNIIYKNSITHSANGIIVGGSLLRKNPKRETRNIIMENDLSYNFTSGITSYNTDAVINKNRIYESVKGNRLFSPRDQSVSNNHFRFNTVAVEVLGNGSTTIHHNIFLEDKTALMLAGKVDGDKNKALIAVIVANSFNRNGVVYALDRIDSVAEFNNHYQQYDTMFRADTSMMNVDVSDNEDKLVELSEDLKPRIREISRVSNPFKGNGRLTGKTNLVHGKWGPYDFNYPLALADVRDSSGTVEIAILGPEGQWTVKEIQGWEVLSVSGKELPGRLVLKKTGTGKGSIQLEYDGESRTGVRREVKTRGPVLFSPPGF